VRLIFILLMAFPIEELYSLRNSREFLSNLIDVQKYPRIPKYIRKQATALLKHYPTPQRLEETWNTTIQEWNLTYQKTKN